MAGGFDRRDPILLVARAVASLDRTVSASTRRSRHAALVELTWRARTRLVPRHSTEPPGSHSGQAGVVRSFFSLGRCSESTGCNRRPAQRILTYLTSTAQAWEKSARLQSNRIDEQRRDTRDRVMIHAPDSDGLPKAQRAFVRGDPKRSPGPDQSRRRDQPS